MDLWIRSQDKKKLIKVNEIKIESVIDGNSFIYSDTTDLGTYKSKERALEVLDEIQRIVNGDDIVERLGNKGNMLNVFPNLFYQMPEE